MSGDDGAGEGAPTGPRIFLSYRRDDSSGYAGHLYEDLTERFGRTNVFMDIDSLVPGVDFLESIEQTIARCDTVLVLIGRGWLGATGRDGLRRLENPHDFVRLEVEAALSGYLRVIPVLVGGTDMPLESEVPESISRLARHQAVDLSDRRWRYDTENLTDAIQRGWSAKSEPPSPASDEQVNDFAQEDEGGRSDDSVIESTSSLRPSTPEDSPDLDNNLPAQLSTFIGRETALLEIKALVATYRLITLTGAGGSGKTRLALQVAGELLDGSGEGAWFVDLAPLADPNLVAATMAQAIGVHEEPGRSVSETLIDGLGDRYLLIVLDNCEHVIDACAKLVDALLRSCPKIHVLATSRAPLSIGGEQLYRVPPLTLPDDDDDRLAAESEAVRLFVARATEARADFVVDDRNVDVVVSLCRRIDGLPLAIELAAARLSSMDLREIEARLNKRFSLLTKGSRSALPRQQTLRALVDWSYDTLSDPERRVISRLSVFAGGWDLRAAEAVAATSDIEIFELVDILDSLVDNSLVQTDVTKFGLRYRLLETIRQFASEKLAESESEELETRTAHAQFFLELAERSASELVGLQQAEWLDRLEVDHDNLRIATDNLLNNPDAGTEVLRIVVALSRFFQARHLREGVEVLEAALNHGTAQRPDALRAMALGLSGDLMEGRERRHHIEEGLAIARSIGDQPLTAELLTWLSSCAYQEGDLLSCSELTEEAVELARSVGDQGLLGRALVRRAIAVGHTDPQQAEPASAEAIEALRSAGDRRWEAAALCNLASFEVIADNLEAADIHYSEALAIVEELHDKSGVTLILAGMGEVAMLQGDLESARTLYSRALKHAYRDKDRSGIVYLILNLAQCFSKMKDEQARAATLFGAADAQNEQLGLPWELGVSAEREEGLTLLKQSMDDASFNSSYSRGRTLTLEAAVQLTHSDQRAES